MNCPDSDNVQMSLEFTIETEFSTVINRSLFIMYKMLTHRQKSRDKIKISRTIPLKHFVVTMTKNPKLWESTSDFKHTWNFVKILGVLDFEEFCWGVILVLKISCNDIDPGFWSFGDVNVFREVQILQKKSFSK